MGQCRVCAVSAHEMILTVDVISCETETQPVDSVSASKWDPSPSAPALGLVCQYPVRASPELSGVLYFFCGQSPCY